MLPTTLARRVRCQVHINGLSLIYLVKELSGCQNQNKVHGCVKGVLCSESGGCDEESGGAIERKKC